jgi:hypothetical protein
VSPEDDSIADAPQSDDAWKAEIEADIAHLFKTLKKINARAAAASRFEGDDTPARASFVDPEGDEGPSGVTEGSPVHRAMRKADVARRFAQGNHAR